jgi:ubiquinone biosynthesis accessory factor UbiK
LSQQRVARDTLFSIQGLPYVDKNDFINDLQDKLKVLLANTPAAEIERNIKVLVTAQLAKFELVTREEFDTQKELLVRLRERANALEERVAQLESKAKDS